MTVSVYFFTKYKHIHSQLNYLKCFFLKQIIIFNMSIDNSDSKRDFLVKALGLGVFAGANVAGIIQTSHALGKVPPKLPPGRSIYQLSGIVSVDGNTADINTVIGSNSIVTTGSDSRVIFVVDRKFRVPNRIQQ